MQKNDIKTLGYVLRRTNYGEADRILNLITPLGKISAVAKGVRKEKSKLAGGIEMFSLSEFTIHQGKSEFGVVTSAKMLKYYSNIIKDYNKMELAALILKKVSLAAEHSESVEYYSIVDQSLAALDGKDDTRLIEAWFLIKLVVATGEEINLYRDINGDRLQVDKCYEWNKYESAFILRENGEFGSNEIKILRLMVTSDYKIVRRIRLEEDSLKKVNMFSKIVAKL